MLTRCCRQARRERSSKDIKGHALPSPSSIPRNSKAFSSRDHGIRPLECGTRRYAWSVYLAIPHAHLCEIDRRLHLFDAGPQRLCQNATRDTVAQYPHLWRIRPTNQSLGSSILQNRSGKGHHWKSPETQDIEGAHSARRSTRTGGTWNPWLHGE